MPQRLASFFHLLRRHPMIVATLLLGLYYVPYLILGQGSYIVINDNLNGELLQRMVIAQSGKAFSVDESIPQIMQGIPRGCLPSGLNVTVWLFMWFTPFLAYLINDIIVHLIALFGLYWLLTRHVIRQDNQRWIAAGAALCFAVLPFWSILGLVFAGLPLLWFALLTIFKRAANYRHWLIILFFPFYSTIAYSSVTVFVPLALWLAWDWLRHKRLHAPLCAALGILLALYIIIDWPLINLLLFKPDFKTSRVAFNLQEKSLPLPAMVNEGCKRFFYGENKMHSKKMLILLAALAAFVYAAIRRQDRRYIAAMLWLWLGLLAMIFVYTFFNWQGFIPIRQAILPLRIIHFDYIRILSPMLLYAAFAMALALLVRIRAGQLIVIALLAGQLALNMNDRDYPEYRLTAVKAVKHMLGRAERNPDSIALSYNEFFAQNQFNDIANYLHMSKKSYRVICFGIHPAIAQYNGFYTLDSYQVNYSYDYMQQFRIIIAKELDKSPIYRNNFDNWGSHCYLYAAEFDQNPQAFCLTKQHPWKVRQAEWNTAKMRAMGAEYLLSAATIANAADLQLKLLTVFEEPQSPWRIHLYRIHE